jgi:hypothetical protein
MRLAADWRMPSLPDAPRPQVLTSALEERSLETEEEHGFVLLGGLDGGAIQPAKAAARIVSDQLRRSARTGRLPPSGSAALARALRERLGRLGLEGEVLKEGTQQAIAMLEGCLSDPKLHWVFSPAHAHIESPCRLSGLQEGRIASMTVDRTFIDGSGVRWLIRFAPDGVAAASPERAWVERVVPLARALGPEPVRAALYDPAGPGWRELHVP